MLSPKGHCGENNNNNNNDEDAKTFIFDHDDDFKLDKQSLRKFEKDWKSQDNFSFNEFIHHIE